MDVKATATVTGLPPTQPIQVNVYVDKDKQGDYLPGYNTYWVIEGILHLGIATREAVGCVDSCLPIYQSTYLAAAAAGAAFGLYNAMNGKPSKGIDKRAEGFAEGELTTKIGIVAEQTIFMAAAMKFAESKFIAPGVTAGNLVAGYWGFQLGAELAGLAYNALITPKDEG